MARAAPVLAALLLAGCSSAPGEPESLAVVARFHAAINAADIGGIDALLTTSTRQLRPGVGTARAFAGLAQRHGAYLDGRATRIAAQDGATRIDWQARYAKGPVHERFVLLREDGAVKIDSYTDNR